MEHGDDDGAPRIEAPSKPVSCPSCGSMRVGRILYGEPALSRELSDDLDAGRVVLGGCCITGDDPAWRCADCGVSIHKTKRTGAP